MGVSTACHTVTHVMYHCPVQGMWELNAKDFGNREM